MNKLRRKSIFHNEHIKHTSNELRTKISTISKNYDLNKSSILKNRFTYHNEIPIYKMYSSIDYDDDDNDDVVYNINTTQDFNHTVYNSYSTIKSDTSKYFSFPSTTSRRKSVKVINDTANNVQASIDVIGTNKTKSTISNNTRRHTFHGIITKKLHNKRRPLNVTNAFNYIRPTSTKHFSFGKERRHTLHYPNGRSPPINKFIHSPLNITKAFNYIRPSTCNNIKFGKEKRYTFNYPNGGLPPINKFTYKPLNTTNAIDYIRPLTSQKVTFGKEKRFSYYRCC